MVSLHWIIIVPLSWSLASQISSHKCNLPVTINSNIIHFGHLSGFSVSPVRPPSHNLPQREGGRWGTTETQKRRESVAVCCFTQSACVLEWADGGSGWHLGGTCTSAGRQKQSSTPPVPSSLSLAFSEWLHLTHSPLTSTHTTHSDALISTTCPHLSACRKDSNMCVAWGRVQEMRVRCTIRSKVCCSPIACLTLCKSAAPS